MLVNERKFIIVLLIILILSIFILIFYKDNKQESEPYKQNNNKILLLIYNNNNELPLIDDKQDVEIINDNNINELVKKIDKNYKNYDAFVIITAKENISYTASLLSFMLENLRKTCVVSNNLSQSVKYASEFNVPEVVVLSNNFIIRGCRARDLGTEIISHNYAELGIVDEQGNIKIYRDNILPFSSDKFKALYINNDKNISIIKGNPNKDVVEIPSDIYIIEGYVTNKKFLDKIKELVEEKGIIAINVGGKKDETIEKYIINSEMSPEAAYGKMSVIISNVPHCDRAMAEQLLSMSMRGEC